MEISPDVSLSFARWLQDLRQKLSLRLLYRLGDLNDIKIWDFGECGSFFHHYHSQYEFDTYVDRELPASQDRSIRYFLEHALPFDTDRPREFTNSSQSYPLEGTQSIRMCGTCHGDGRVTCHNCGGSGRTTDAEGKRSRCMFCSGSGQNTCSHCSGEGRLICFTTKDYRWKAVVDEEPILAEETDRREVRSLLRKARKAGGSLEVEVFSREEVLRQSGVVHQRIEPLLTLAKEKQVLLEQRIQDRGGVMLFQDVRREYTPLEFINLSTGKKYGQYFVGGTLETTIVSRPPLKMDRLKVLGWVGLVALIASLVTPIFRPDFAAYVWYGVGFAGLMMTAGPIAWFRERKIRPPSKWLIFNDDENRGWFFCYHIAQSFARARQALVKDPCYSFLMEAPDESAGHDRNSLFFTLVGSGPNAGRQWEIVTINERAHTPLRDDIQALLAQSLRCTFFLGRQKTTSLDDTMAAWITDLPAASRTDLEVTVITPSQRPCTAADFPKTSDLLGLHPIHCYSIAVEQLFEASRTNTLNDDQLKALQVLPDYFHFR